jgi:hypothetical protein
MMMLRKLPAAAAAAICLSVPLNMASAHTGMAIRNDLPKQAVTIPAGYYPRAGTCRLWYPARAASQQPGLSNCDVTIPAGAMLLLGM